KPHLSRPARSCGRFVPFNFTAGGRKTNNDPRATVRRILSRDRAAVCFDNRSNDGQPHPHTLLFGGKEMIKNLVRAVLRQADAKIAHRYFGYIALVRACLNINATLAWFQTFARVER